VLFVDDDEALLRAIRRNLRLEPLRVRTALGADEALEVLEAEPIDVVVSDLEMPGTNGIELLSAVRARYPKVVRMLLTGSATLTSALEAINEGEVARFFLKPFDSELFLASLALLEERIARAQHVGAESTRPARAEALESWLEARFPGIRPLEASEGEVELELDGLLFELDRDEAMRAVARLVRTG
jgi:DNA-binding NtrC family response regulator